MAAADRPAWRPWWGIAAAAILTSAVLCLVTVGTEESAVGVGLLVVPGGAVAAAGWVLLRTRRQRREYEDRLTAWAAERAASGERLRIARELHDLVSHGLGLVIVRAATAARWNGPAADAERVAALVDIERVGRQATDELRRMLEVLRTPGGESAPLRPSDRLTDLPAIVAEAGAASGVTVSLDLPEEVEASSGVQVAVCAIVREALTNTARYAGPTRASVAVRRAGAAVVVEVQDVGPVVGWRPRPGAGHGLVGLRERVAALGGTLDAGPAGGPVDSGFRLRAWLPDRPAA